MSRSILTVKLGASRATQFYLNKRYVVKVLVDNDQVTNVKLSRGKLNVTLKHKLAHAPEDRIAKVKNLISENCKNA